MMKLHLHGSSIWLATLLVFLSAAASAEEWDVQSYRNHIRQLDAKLIARNPIKEADAAIRSADFRFIGVNTGWGIATPGVACNGNQWQILDAKLLRDVIYLGDVVGSEIEEQYGEHVFAFARVFNRRLVAAANFPDTLDCQFAFP